MGTLLRSTLLAAAVLVFLWLRVNLVLDTLALEQFSPIALNRAIPMLLRMPWREQAAEASSGLSQDDVEALAQQAEPFMRILSGRSAPPAPPPPAGFFERHDLQSFSLTRVPNRPHIEQLSRNCGRVGVRWQPARAGCKGYGELLL